MSRLLWRRLHAGAWWLWALALAFAATRTTNPLLLGLIVAVAVLVATARSDGESGTPGLGFYLVIAGVVVAIRIVFRALLGGDVGTRVLFTLPQLSLLGGIELGGPVTIEELLAGFYDGLRLATIIVCIGAANALADPRRLLASFPRALGGVAASVAVALSLTPQLIDSVSRVRAARRLRGETKSGWRSIRSLLVPVLEDSLSRSVALAASMDSRGFGRSLALPAAAVRTSRVAGVAGLLLAVVGMVALLSVGNPAPGTLLVLAGSGAGVTALTLLGRGVSRSRYRPEPWAWPEWAVVAAGLAAPVGVMATASVSPAALHPSVVPLQWPLAPPLAFVAILAAALAAVVAPRPLPPSLTVEEQAA
jgi:energy-coupling factor transport system permease protein